MRSLIKAFYFLLEACLYVNKSVIPWTQWHMISNILFVLEYFGPELLDFKPNSNKIQKNTMAAPMTLGQGP